MVFSRSFRLVAGRTTPGRWASQAEKAGSIPSPAPLSPQVTLAFEPSYAPFGVARVGRRATSVPQRVACSRKRIIDPCRCCDLNRLLNASVGPFDTPAGQCGTIGSTSLPGSTGQAGHHGMGSPIGWIAFSTATNRRRAEPPRELRHRPETGNDGRLALRPILFKGSTRAPAPFAMLAPHGWVTQFRAVSRPRGHDVRKTLDQSQTRSDYGATYRS